MTDHPLTEARAAELWDAHRESGVVSLSEQGRLYVRWQIAMLRAAYDAGREDALTPLDPLAYLKPGTVLRDATIVGAGSVGDAFVSTDTNGRCVVSARHRAPLNKLVEFTTDDCTTRYTYYTHHGGIWTTENLNGDTDD